MINGRADGVHHDHHRHDHEDQQQGHAGKAQPGRQLEHPVDEVALVVGGVGGIDARPATSERVDGGNVAEILDVDLELCIKRIALDLLREDDVLRIRLELRERLFLGDESNARHASVGRQLLLEVGHGLQRRVI